MSVHQQWGLWNNKNKAFHKIQFATLVGKKGQTNSGGVINVAAKVRAAHNNVTFKLKSNH